MKRMQNVIVGGLGFLVGGLPSCRENIRVDMNRISEQERAFAESFDPRNYSQNELDYMVRIHGFDLKDWTPRDVVLIYRKAMIDIYNKIDIDNLTESDKKYLADFDLSRWNDEDREFVDGFNYLFDSKRLTNRDKIFLGRIANFYVGELANLPRD